MEFTYAQIDLNIFSYGARKGEYWTGSMFGYREDPTRANADEEPEDLGFLEDFASERDGIRKAKALADRLILGDDAVAVTVFSEGNEVYHVNQRTFARKQRRAYKAR